MGLLQETGLDSAAEQDSICSLGACVILAFAASLAAVEWTLKVRHNCFCTQASERGRALHYYVAARYAAVQALEASLKWSAHFSRHNHRDALWHFRCVPVWRPAAVCSQACSLLAWAWLIYPHCDAVLATGVFANLLHFIWRLSRAALRLRRRRQSPVAEWFEELEETDSSSGEESDATDTPGLCTQRREAGNPKSEAKTTPARPSSNPGEIRPDGCVQKVASTPSNCRSVGARRRASTPRCSLAREHPSMEESVEELKERNRIEAMRKAQEKWAAGCRR